MNWARVARARVARQGRAGGVPHALARAMAHARARSTVRRACAQELNACVNQGIVFTLEEGQGDGWDDVRRGVIEAKKVLRC